MNGGKVKELYKKYSKQIEEISSKNKLSEKLVWRKIKKLYKLGIISCILMCISSICFADIIIIPFSCYPKNIQEKYKKRGYKLDLSAEDRTKDSWAFIVSEGSAYKIITYKSISLYELDLIKEVSFNLEGELNGK